MQNPGDAFEINALKMRVIRLEKQMSAQQDQFAQMAATEEAQATALTTLATTLTTALGQIATGVAALQTQLASLQGTGATADDVAALNKAAGDLAASVTAATTAVAQAVSQATALNPTPAPTT